MEEINVCPGTLTKGYNTYSPKSKRNMFFNKKVSHILPYDSPNNSEESLDKFIENRKRISISGVQEKLSLILDKNQLRLTNHNEQGRYILKPIPRDIKWVDQVPANEHLTMQIASQVFKIKTAENALIFFKTGESAYITKRFDVLDDGSKLAKEDFASLSERTSQTHGKNFKYENISYEEIAELIKKYVGAYQIEIEKYFKLILFNFLFSNGDAHLKNFSLLETEDGDFILSPAYDLLNTRLHVADTFFALKKGLFKEKEIGIPTRNDFIKFGVQIGIKEKRVLKTIDQFTENKELVHNMIERSFLNNRAKNGYKIHYNTRLNILSK